MSKEIFSDSIFNFFVDKILGKAWRHFKENWLTFLLSILTSIAVMIGTMASYVVLIFIGNVADVPVGLVVVATPLLLLAIFAIQVIMSAGWLRLLLNIVDDKKPMVSDLFSEYKKLFTLIGVMIVYIFMVGAGLIFFVIPGIILAITFMWAPMLVVDKNMGVVEALKKSKELNDGSKWDLLLLGSLLMFAYYTMSISIIGIVVALPVIAISKVLIYRHIQR